MCNKSLRKIIVLKYLKMSNALHFISEIYCLLSKYICMNKKQKYWYMYVEHNDSLIENKHT